MSQAIKPLPEGYGYEEIMSAYEVKLSTYKVQAYVIRNQRIFKPEISLLKSSQVFNYIQIQLFHLFSILMNFNGMLFLSKYALILFLVFALGHTTSYAALNGIYTIDPSKAASSTNYVSFTDAVSDLLNGTRSSGTANGPGVSGQVVFKIADGIYTEQLSITAIPNASSTNNVIFQSVSLDSTKVRLEFPSSASDASNFVIALNSASYITFRHMTIERTGGLKFGRAIITYNAASYNSFTNNRIIARAKSADVFSELITVSGPHANLIADNYLKGCGIAINCSGAQSLPEKSISILRNRIDSTQGTGIVISSGRRFEISGNSMSGEALVCIDMRGCKNSVKIDGNKIEGGTRTVYGIYLENSGYAFNDTLLITNNFIHLLPVPAYRAYGIYLLRTEIVKIAHNNVLVESKTYGGYDNYAGYMEVSGVTSLNNNWVNTGGGCAFGWSGSPGTPVLSDYNNFYATAKYPFLSQSLSDWQASTGHDKNSHTVDPKFESNTDLHIGNWELRKAGVNTSVGFDIDGAKRPAGRPTIGADELPFIDNNITLQALDSPAAPYCHGTHNLWVRVRNNGSNTVTKFSVGWELDGVSQATVNWSGNLSSEKDVVVKLGTITSDNKPKNLILYTYNPNGSTDPSPRDDTLEMNLAPHALDTVYIIGSSGKADYASFNAAVKDLVLRGVCRPVVFNVEDGIYNERFRIPFIRGTSKTNTITFQSESQDSSNVRIDTSAVQWGTPNYNIVLLDGAAFVTFRKMSFARWFRTSDYCMSGLVEISGGSHDITFESCSFSIKPGYCPSTTCNNYGIFSLGSIDSNITIRKNYFKGGEAAIYFTVSSLAYENGNRIENNIVDSATDLGISLSNQCNLVVSGNRVHHINFSNANPGIKLLRVKGLRLEKNRVHLPRGGRGLNLTLIEELGNDTPLIANNFVSVAGSWGNSTSHGLFMLSNTAKLVHNSFFVYLDGTTYERGQAAWIAKEANSRYKVSLRNNIFAITTNNICAELDPEALGESDNNVFYSPREDIIMQVPLSEWQSATGFEMNSIIEDPKFISNSDLHITNRNLIGKGVAMLVKDDIDGADRPDAATTIGAHELSFYDHAVIKEIIGPSKAFCAGSHDIHVKLRNDGYNILHSARINWMLNGIRQPPVNWSGTLSPKQEILVLLSGVFLEESVKIQTWVDSLEGKKLPTKPDTTVLSTMAAAYPFPKSAFTYTIDSMIVRFKAPDTTLAGYRWHFGDGDSSSYHSPLKTYAAMGKYLVRLTVVSKDNCRSTHLDTVTVDGTSGAAAPELSDRWRLYPNPVISGYFILERKGPINNRPIDLKISDLSGKIVFMNSFLRMTRIEVNLPSLKPGVYTVELFERGTTTGSTHLLLYVNR